MSKQKGIVNEENLEKEAPLLHSIPKRSPFTVPDGYFDGLPSSILEKCREVTSAPPAFSKIFWLFRPQWMMAVFVCAICLGFFFRNTSQNVTLETLTSEVSDSAIYNHLQNNIENVDVNSLADAVQGETFTVQPATEDTTGQEEINYLINHNVDASDIENEL